MQRTISLRAAVLLTVAGTLALIGSAKAEPPILRISLEDEPTTLEWNHVRSPSERFVTSFLMRGLLRYSEDLRPVCDLCRSYQVLESGRLYRFQIDTAVQWSDDSPLQASNFVDSFRRLKTAPKRNLSGDESDLIATVSAPSREVLEIELKKPSNIFPHFLTQVQTYPIHGKSTLGPYLLAAWEKGRRIVIEGNPASPRARPVYRVEFIIGKHPELLTRFKNGKIDVFANPTTDEVMKAPGSRMQLSHYWATRCLLFNTRRTPVSNSSMRKAILGSIDRATLPSILKNGEKTATGLIPPGLNGFSSEVPSPQSLEQVQGDRHRAVPWPRWVDLELLLHDDPTDRAVAAWLGEQLSKIHVKLRTKAQRQTDFYSDLEGGKFDIVLHSLAYETASPLGLFRGFESGSRKNWGGWTNLAFDTLLERITSSVSGEAAPEALNQLKDLVETQDPAVVPLTFPAHSFLLNSRVKSFAVTPFGDPDLLRTELSTPTPAGPKN